MKTYLAGAILVASVAAAQPAPSADVEQLWLDPSARGSLFIGNGRTLAASRFRASVAAYYTQDQLRSSQGGNFFAPLLQNRFGFQVTGALGITDWFELGVNFPVFVYQAGSTLLNVASAGLGNPWLTAKVNLLDAHQPISMSLIVGAGIPVGTPVAQGSSGSVDFAPRVQLGRVYDKWQFGLELGWLHRTVIDYERTTGTPDTRVGGQFFLGAMIATVNPEGPRGEVTFRGFVPLAGGTPGLEGQIGFRWQLGPIELIASAGPGFGHQLTTPSVRGYFGVAVGNVEMTPPTCVEGRKYVLSECPELDRDEDGVLNGVDADPNRPEDRDGYQDDDGAPDPDNDGDGTIDELDECPDVAGPAGNQGCPDSDEDKDGVVDRLDKCPREKEDKDDFEDGDGCPEADNDGDGLLDGADACPLQAGIAQEKGCPAKDTDGDVVFDHEDNCPQEKGTQDNAGCPEAQKQLVVITKDGLRLLDRISFDKTSVQKKSFVILDNVAQVLVVHPEIALVQIEGPADRAASVRAYLIKKGIAESRLRVAATASQEVGFRFP